MRSIDLVVTYCNSNDEEWQKQYKFYKEQEIKKGIQNENNQQAFNDCRYRDWGLFKYWFRGVEKNCPWINKIFLVVQNEKHIPNWLDIKNPKLKIVFHKDFIPSHFLPTFNAMTIEMFIHRIPGLSETYITSDDDFYFLNPTNSTRFFTYNGQPCSKDNQVKYKLASTDTIDGTFGHILNNNLEIEKNYISDNNLIKYGLYHLPAPKLKSFEYYIFNNHKEIFEEGQLISKFRHPNNYCFPIIIDDLLKITKKSIIRNPYIESDRCIIRENTNFQKYANKEMVCFNDGELTPYSKKEELNKFLMSIFPEKSSFEKQEKYGYLVEALDTYQKLKIQDGGLNKIPVIGETWVVSADRLDVLLGQNIYNKPFVKMIGEL